MLLFQPGQFQGPHFQTIAANLLGRTPFPFKKKIGPETTATLKTQDASGDQIHLDIHRQKVNSRKTNTVILVHGMEGSSSSVYVVKLTEKLLELGFHVVRVNLRSCGPGNIVASNLYNAGLTIDLETAVDYVYKHISPRIAVVGYSLGANVLLKYLGEDRAERNRQIIALGGKKKTGRIKNRKIETFIAVSPPLDLSLSQQKIDSPNCKIYRNIFLKELQKKIAEKRKEKIKRVYTLYDFDDVFTAPVAGFSSAAEYYANSSAAYYLPGIQTPGHILHSIDDPLIASDPFSGFRHDLIDLHLTEYGGHVGWLSKKHQLIPDRRWMDYFIVYHLSRWKEAEGHGLAQPVEVG